MNFNQAGNPKIHVCPRCASTKEEGHERCFHCSDCGYLQCCDTEGFYTRKSLVKK